MAASDYEMSDCINKTIALYVEEISLLNKMISTVNKMVSSYNKMVSSPGPTRDWCAGIFCQVRQSFPGGWQKFPTSPLHHFV
jgi:hypothetical protein